jgi:hypothetical protein
MPSRKLFFLLILSAIAGVVAFFLVPKPLPELTRQELIAEVRSGYVHEVVIVDGEVLTAASTRRGRFRVVLRRGDNGLIEELSAMRIEVKFETTSDLVGCP